MELKNEIKKFIFLLFTFVFGLNAVTQNLIPNPSFEDTLSCPVTIGPGSNMSSCKDWYAISGNSPDYLNTCAPEWGGGSIPNNHGGYQIPRTGDAYCGVILNTYLESIGDWNEYIGVKTKEPLSLNTSYLYRMHLNLADNSQHTSDSFGVLFSTDKIATIPFINGRTENIKRKPQLEIDSLNFLVEREDWVLFEKEFIADSAYAYLTIGNFKNHLETNLFNTTLPSGFQYEDFPYFYIDDVSLIPIQYICQGDSVTLNSHNSQPYQWISEYQPNQVISSDSIITVSPQSNTEYYNFYDGDTSTFIVRVLEDNALDLGLDTNLCIGEKLALKPNLIPDTDYLWQDGSTDRIFTVEDSGTYWVELTNLCGTFTDSITVTYNTISVDLGSDTVICKGGSPLTLDAGIPNSKYLWQDFATTTQTYTTILYASDLFDKFWVRVSNENGCGTDTVLITHMPDLINGFLPDDTVMCEYDVLKFPGLTNSEYSWSTGSKDSILEITETGKYWVTIENYCYSVSDTVNIEIKKFPYFYLASDTTICNGKNLNLDLNLPAKTGFGWMKYTNPVTQENIKDIDKPGKYYIKAFNTICSYTDSINVEYDDCLLEIRIPNVFTPNYDGENDGFYVTGNNITNFHLTIINRWGNKVFISEDINRKWMGIDNRGKNCTEGVYFYVIEVSNEYYSKTYQGNITLIR